MNLTTQYLGLSLKNPLVAGAGPITGKLDNIRRLEDFGAAAVVLPSIFEEQIAQEERLIDRLATLGVDSYSEARSYFPSAAFYQTDPQRYLELLYRAARAVDVPVIVLLSKPRPSVSRDVGASTACSGRVTVSLDRKRLGDGVVVSL